MANEVLVGQANVLELPIVAKATGNPITAGVVRFYLVAKDGANASKWFRGADTSWQAVEALAGNGTHRADGHWRVSLPTVVWMRDVAYRVYAKESGDLHIPVGENLLAKLKNMDVILKAWAAGNWRLKSGQTDVYELLDADDGVTVIVEMTLSQTTPFRTVTVMI